MSYLREAFAELWRQDGLIVMARGLGVRRLLAKFLLLHCMHGDAPSPLPTLDEGADESQQSDDDARDPSESNEESNEQSPPTPPPSPAAPAVRANGGVASARPPAETSGSRPLVLCLNTTGEEELFLDALMADGVPPVRLPEVVDAESPPVRREQMYRSGGVFLVTSRVLIVDLLNQMVHPQRISGILVHKAHRVVETSSEAFILRIFREGNRSGFVKGFTDEPESLLAGFGRLEKILRNLGVSKVFLWPRFHSMVAECLERRPPEVEELVQGLTGPTKEVQQAIVVLMDHTLKELRSSAPSSLDSSELTVERCIFQSFDRSIKRQLEPEWHRVGFKTKQLLQDLSTLRSLLDYVFRYDAVTFYQLLLAEKSKAAAVRDPPLWIGTAAADRLFVTAKARLYKVTKVAGETGGSKKRSKGNDSADRVDGGNPSGSSQPPGERATYRLDLVLEENAKWRLATDVLREIRDIHASRVRANVSKWKRRAKSSSDFSSADATRKPSTGSTTPGAASANYDDDDDGKGGKGVYEGWEPAGGARVLVLVRDEHSCAQLRQHSALGGRLMMRQRFAEFIRETEERTGRIAAARGGRGGGGGGGRNKNRRTSSTGGTTSSGHGGRRWSGNHRGKGGVAMTGVGIGASPAFSYRGGGGGNAVGDGEDGDGEAEEGNAGGGRASAAAVERRLLKETGEMLETELTIALVSSSKALLGADGVRAVGGARTDTGGRVGAGSGRGNRGSNFGRGGRGTPLRRGRGRGNKDRGVGRAGRRVEGVDRVIDVDTTVDREGGTLGESDVELIGKGTKKRSSVHEENGIVESVDPSEGQDEDEPDTSPHRAEMPVNTNSAGPGMDPNHPPLPKTPAGGREGNSGVKGKKRARTVTRRSEGGGRGLPYPPDDGQGVRGGVTFEPLPSLHAVMFSYTQAGASINILRELEPDFVVLYDPDAAFVRALEAYQAGRASDRPPVTVYFMLYEQSVEEQRYLTSLDRETKAFKGLIEEKARMTVPISNAAAVELPLERPGGGSITNLSAPAGSGARDARGGQMVTSRRGGGGRAASGKQNAPPKVVVDLREFRSVLPNLLHQQGFELVPMVIAVGDYVLTPEICVERKSLPDLFQSMSSGRLYNQVESMLKHYKVPILLIEFNPEKPFCLLGAGDLMADIKPTSITSQLTLLTIHFPQLRILWSKSEHATAEMFKQLMKNNSPVDVAKALAAGGGGEEGDADVRSTAKELLMRLPGVNVHNYRKVLREVDTIADLSEMSEEQLRPLLGAANATKLFNFFRQAAPL